MKHLLYILLFSAINFSINAQVTLIPDENFEEALIDQGIDTDGIINGQVNTSDIENITELTIIEKGIWDMTGIEGFASLEYLDCDYNYFDSIDLSNNSNLNTLFCSNNSELTELDLSGNPNLIDLYCIQNNLTSLNVTQNLLLEGLSCGNPEWDVGPWNRLTTIDLSNNTQLKYLGCDYIFTLEELDLSNNPNLITLYAFHSALSSLNVKNGNNEILTVVTHENNLLYCIEVDDDDAANNNQPPYNAWFVDPQVVYSKDCSLSANDYNLSNISITPNPAADIIHIENSGNEITGISIYDISGRIIMQPKENFSQIDISMLEQGVLLLHIETSTGFTTRKAIRK